MAMAMAMVVPWQARRRLQGIIQGVIRQRRQESKAAEERRDFLGALMAESGYGDGESGYGDGESGYGDGESGDGESGHGSKRSLSDQQIVDNIIGVIFASRDTTASALTWILKFLKSDPHLLRAVVVSVPFLKILP
jgi:(+)-abscisic acid 8'-hydroxylase